MTYFRTDRAATHVSLAGLYALFFFSTFSTAGYNVALALLLTATLLSAKPLLLELYKTPIFILISILTLYVLLRSLAALNQTPEIASESNPNWTHHLRTTGAISLVSGWWIYRQVKHFKVFFALAISGLFVGVLHDGDLNTIASLDFSSRYVWGYNPNYLGMIAGIAFIALMGSSLFCSIWKHKKSITTVMIGACILSLFMVLTSQSRAAWLGLTTSLPALVFLYINYSYRKGYSFLRIAKISAPFIAFAILFLSFYDDFFINRLMQEKEVVKHLLSGEIDLAAALGGSSGLRVAAWLVGFETLLAQSIAGAGPSTSSQLLSDYNLGHFHNIYLEIIVSFGLIGGILYLTITTLLIYYLYNAYKQGLISFYFFSTLIAATIFVAVMLFFDIHIGQPGGRAVLNTLGAIYVVAFLRYQNAKKYRKEASH